MFPKKQKKKSRKIVERLRQEAKCCLACGRAAQLEVDHITTRGAGGGDEENNLWILCFDCHRKRHSLGWSKFLSTHSHLVQKLKEMGREDILERVKRWAK